MMATYFTMVEEKNIYCSYNCSVSLRLFQNEKSFQFNRTVFKKCIVNTFHVSKSIHVTSF